MVQRYQHEYSILIFQDPSNADAKFTPISPSLVDACWERAEPMIERACAYSNGRFTPESVRDEIDKGIQVLWVLYKGDDDMMVVLTTSIQNYPDRKMLNIPFCGSDGSESYWHDNRSMIISRLKDWASQHGCSGIELSGRKGWEKVLSPLGFEKSYIVLELEI
jgi:hypothetical protein